MDRLKSLGMAKAQTAVNAAKSNGLSPTKCLEAAEHWNSKLSTTHGIGALYDWLLEATPEQAVDDARFWPASKPLPGKPSQEMRAGLPIERYRQHIATIRNLPKLFELTDAVGIDRQKVVDRGIDGLSSDERDRLVCEYVKRLSAG